VDYFVTPFKGQRKHFRSAKNISEKDSSPEKGVGGVFLILATVRKQVKEEASLSVYDAFPSFLIFVREKKRFRVTFLTYSKIFTRHSRPLLRLFTRTDKCQL